MFPKGTGNVLINRKLYRNPLSIDISFVHDVPPLDPFRTTSSARKVQLKANLELEA
jgi:hypothetical protein